MSLKYQEDPIDENGPADGSDAERRYGDLPVYTILLIAAYSGVFISQLSTGLDASILLAGFDKAAFLQKHEYWRLLTGAALHANLLHYFMNSYAFYSFGRTFEVLSDRAHIAIVFLLSAIGGGVLSLIVSPAGISIGASGGIVGLVGYLVVYSFIRRQFISAEFRKSLIINIGFILFFGFVLMRSVDNFAHIGGLVTGAVYGALQIPRDSYTDPRESSQITKTAGLVSLGIYAAICGFAILVILRLV